MVTKNGNCCERAMAAERERCARIAETEPEPEGPIPDEIRTIVLADPEFAIKVAIQSTKKSIAENIRKE